MRCAGCNKPLTVVDLCRRVPNKPKETNDLCSECRSIINEATYKDASYSDLSFHKAMGGQERSEDIFQHISDHGSIDIEDLE